MEVQLGSECQPGRMGFAWSYAVAQTGDANSKNSMGAHILLRIRGYGS